MTEIPKKMQALVLTGDGYSVQATGPAISDASDWLELKEIDVPTPGEGEVLIEVLRSSVNPSDMHFIKGEYGQPRVQGQASGFEGCGVVVDGPKAFLGRRVAFAVPTGAWASYVVAAAHSCIPLRDEVSDNDGAAQIVNPMTAIAMVTIAKKGGDAVIITAAASQLGKLMIALAKDLGLAVIAVVRRADRDGALSALGAEEVLCTQDSDFAERAGAAIARLKPQVLLDAVGDQVTEQLFVRMPARSVWISYGKLSSEAPRLTQMGQFIFMDKRIEGFWLSKWFRTVDDATRLTAIKQVQDRFADGRWRTDVSCELPIERAIAELAEATQRRDGKVVLVMKAQGPAAGS